MALNLLLLVGGLVLVVKGGDLFVSSSVRIAGWLRMSRVVIGSTLVSLATTTPELTVSLVSGLKGESGLALGNAVGACLCNLGLILGTLATLRRVAVHPQTLRAGFAAMIGCGLLVFALALGSELSRGAGVGLLLLGAAYFAVDFRRHRRHASASVQAEAAELETEWVRRHAPLQSPRGTILRFLGGAAFVAVGSKCLVEAAVEIAAALGVPSLFIGLTVVAVGTSLPELVTAFSSSRQNVSDLAVGNVLGANIANLTLVVGSAAVVQPIPVSRVTLLFSFPALLAFMVLVYGFMVRRGALTRRAGVGLLIFYGFYLLGLISFALAGMA